ncbi:hypothetical protein DNTS_016647 [Danionella cerebrum]|uniref:Uncharacterized protein n=1 Tax=Danionella cerebrum TaxID=2873325 RepID=A0A553Q0C0_9TELE|nr:hypothetical protein DNTS_016647 [Danionella translucida]
MQQLRPEENSVTHDSCSEVELSHQALQPLRPEDSITRDSLYGADLSHHALQQLRGEFPSEAQPQISADELSVTHNSLCLGSLPEEAEQEVMSVMKQSVLTELLERAQASGEERGILEESMLSFISLPESVESHQHREAEEKGCSREEEKEEIVTWSHRLWSPFEEEEEKKVPLIHQHRASNFQQVKEYIFLSTEDPGEAEELSADMMIS